MRPAVKWALIGSMASLLWIATEFMLGFHDANIQYHAIVSNLALIIPLLTFRQTVEDSKPLFEDFSFRIAFSECMIGVLIMTVLAPVSAFVFYKYMNPDFFNCFIQYAGEHASEMGVSKEKAIQRALRFYNLQAYMIQSFLSTLVSGVLIAALVSYLQTRTRNVS